MRRRSKSVRLGISNEAQSGSPPSGNAELGATAVRLCRDASSHGGWSLMRPSC